MLKIKELRMTAKVSMNLRESRIFLAYDGCLEYNGQNNSGEKIN